MLPELEEPSLDEASEVSEVELLLLSEVELSELSEVLAVEVSEVLAVELSDVELLSDAEAFDVFDPEASEVFVMSSESSSIAVLLSLLVSSVSFAEELSAEELLLLLSVVFVVLSVAFVVLSDEFELAADSVVLSLLFAVVSEVLFVAFVAFVALPLSEIPALVSFEAGLSVLLVAAVLSFNEPLDEELVLLVEVVFERSVEFVGSEVEESDWARKAVMKRNRRRR